MFSKPISPAMALGLIAAVLLTFCGIYYNTEIFQGPRGIHDWAQADRLALAIGYYDDGMNFFRPTTLSEWSRERVTGVEAPLQAYLTAAVAKVTGRGSLTLVFRLISLCISLAGALIIFSAAFRVTRHFLSSAFTPVMLFCSPVVISYSASFLPDAPALWVFMIAVACLMRYFQTDHTNTLAWAMCWLSVATLMKTTLALYFLPIALYVGADRLRQDGRAFLRTSWLPLLVTLAGFSVVGAWYMHAQALNRTYQSSLFLASAQPFKDGEEVSNYFNHGMKYWLRDYFAWPQYGLLPVMFAVALPFTSRQRGFERRLNWLVAVCGIGAVTAFCTMGHQLFLHDYYVVSMVYPLVAVLLFVACLRLHGLLITLPAQQGRRAIEAGLAAALLMSFFFADYQFYRRIVNDYPPARGDGHWPGDWLIGGADLLKRLGIPDTTRILAAEERPPNRALVYFDRRGIHMSDETWGRGFEAVYNLAQERRIRYVVWERKHYERALTAPGADHAQYFDVLTPAGEKVVLRLKETQQ